MIVMIWLAVFIVFLYTSGFAISLWKQKNKLGSLVVLILAVIGLVFPYYLHMI